jgi:hypothetical protein
VTEPDLAPALSLIVVGYNMARELPRTLRSLAPCVQRGIAERDYEILLIDNGSDPPVDDSLCRRFAGNAKLMRVDRASPSPVRAINAGLGRVRGEVVGVCIDGARMASPGLLSMALAATRIHHRAVVGTVALHLGPDVQSRSVVSGYDQTAEDRLLDESGWEDDGYRLFDISVFAGSSRDGWFVVPAETNAVFMRAALWRELGGYDERFISAGGGLANLDLWARACRLPDACVTMLLGEATFHQFHGGVATNSPVSRWPEFHAEYRAVRGHGYARPRPPVQFFGSLDHIPAASLRSSVDSLEASRREGASRHDR